MALPRLPLRFLPTVQPRIPQSAAAVILATPCRCSLSTAAATKPASPITYIKTLRERIGAPMSECKAAIQTVLSDHPHATEEEVLEAAIEWLRKQGKASAAKKQGRSAAEGLIGIHTSNDSIAMVELNSETDFCARNDRFQSLVDQIAETACKSSALHSNGNISIDELSQQPLASTALTIGDTITDTVTSLREKIHVRRALRYQQASHVHYASYVHNNIGGSSMQSKLGKVGCIVELQTDSSVQLTAEQRQHLTTIGQRIAMHIVALNPTYTSRSDVPAEVIAHEQQLLHEQLQNTMQGKTPQQVQKIVEGRLNKYYEEHCLVEQKFVVVGQDEKPQKVGVVLQNEGKAMELPSLKVTSFVKYVVGEGVEVQQKVSFAEEVRMKAEAQQ